MQMSNGRKAFYITFSILLSFIIWFMVNNRQNVDVAINDIPVEFLNADSALANKGLMLIEGSDATVDLVLNMPRSLVYDFDTEHVRVFADLNSVTSTGTQLVSYSISYPTNISRSQVSVRSPAVQNVSVRIGSLFRRDDVEIRCKLTGNVADGFVAGSLQLNPESLEIWGQQSDVMQVSFAQVTLNIENASSTIVELLEYELYDYNNELIENKNIHAASDSIQVTMPVIAATDVPLVVNFIEAPGVRKDSFDITLDTASVTLSGDANQIAQLGEIVLGEVDLTQIEGSETFTYDIPLPEGLTNLSGTTTATLTVVNRDVTTKNLVITDFEYDSFDLQERSVEIVTSSLSVTLRGAKEVLDGITAENLHIIADLSGVSDASGTYTVPASARIDGSPDVGTTQNYQLTVRILPQQAEEPADEEPTDDGTTPGEETGNDTNSNG